MRFGLSRADEMADVVASGVEELGEQTPVAALPRRLRAHQARRRRGECLRECGLPRLSGHAGGVGAEGVHPDAGEALLSRLVREPPAKRIDGAVADSGLAEGG